MKTNDEIEAILAHLIDKLNRVEAAQAHQSEPNSIRIDINTSANLWAVEAINDALDRITKAGAELKSRMRSNGGRSLDAK